MTTEIPTRAEVYLAVQCLRDMDIHGQTENRDGFVDVPNTILRIARNYLIANSSAKSANFAQLIPELAKSRLHPSSSAYCTRMECSYLPVLVLGLRQAIEWNFGNETEALGAGSD